MGFEISDERKRGESGKDREKRKDKKYCEIRRRGGGGASCLAFGVWEEGKCVGKAVGGCGRLKEKTKDRKN